MNVKILRTKDKKVIDAIIRKGIKSEMPSIQDGWRFNFNKQSRLPNSETYVLVCKDSPKVIEGCLIFQMVDKEMPFMAFLEIAPHNQQKKKQYDYVAGCLIAFASRPSFIRGQEHFKGWLSFEVHEETNSGQIKLMSLYSKKYYARKTDENTMMIIPSDGEILIEEFLKRKG